MPKNIWDVRQWSDIPFSFTLFASVALLVARGASRGIATGEESPNAVYEGYTYECGDDGDSPILPIHNHRNSFVMW